MPATTPIADVVRVVFEKVSFDGGPVKKHLVRSQRTVSISGAAYEAVVVDTDLGQKIVLLQHQPSSGWWSRVFDATTPVSAPPATTSWVPARCDAERRRLDAALDNALTCGSDADCATVAYACLGSCGRAVSASKLGPLRARLDAFQKGCGSRCPVAKCAPWVTNAPVCNAGSCVIPKS